MLPIINLGKLKDLKPVMDLELIPVVFKTLLIDPNNGSSALVEIAGKSYVFPLNQEQGGMITFAQAGLNSHAHIKNIYQLYLEAHEIHMQYKLKTATIEAKMGDIFYAKLQWEHKNGNCLYTPCVVGDAFILHLLSKSKLQIVNNLLLEMEELDEEWQYMDESFDV